MLRFHPVLLVRRHLQYSYHHHNLFNPESKTFTHILTNYVIIKLQVQLRNRLLLSFKAVCSQLLYWIGLLFTGKNGDFGAFSVKGESSGAAPISKVERHIGKVFILYPSLHEIYTV